MTGNRIKEKSADGSKQYNKAHGKHALSVQHRAHSPWAHQNHQNASPNQHSPAKGQQCRIFSHQPCRLQSIDNQHHSRYHSPQKRFCRNRRPGYISMGGYYKGSEHGTKQRRQLIDSGTPSLFQAQEYQNHGRPCILENSCCPGIGILNCSKIRILTEHHSEYRKNQNIAPSS